MFPKLLPLLALLDIRTDSLDSDEDKAIAAVIEVLTPMRADAAKAERVATLEGQNATITAERDAAVARADTAEARVAELEAAEKARTDAAERTRLDALVKARDLSVESVEDIAVYKRAIATALQPKGARADSLASDAYCDALIDIAEAALSESRADGIPKPDVDPTRPPAKREDGDDEYVDAFLTSRADAFGGNREVA